MVAHVLCRYGHMAEVMGRNLWAAEVFNCQFPDTGNMDVLHMFGTSDQQLTWLEPLKRGMIRSAFVMTEPGVASSDATSISATIRRDDTGGGYIVNGLKWWISGAGDPRCKLFLVLGRSAAPGDTSLPRHRQHSIIIVPRDAAGVVVEEAMSVYGFDDAPHGHFVVRFDDVRVPASNIIAGEGRGFEIAQARLGPGRVHHCMRTIGLMERALELMLDRVTSRHARGHPMSEFGAIRKDIADMRIAIDAARELTVAAARAIDAVGSKEARKQIACIKVHVPLVAQRVIDMAIQAHGGVGMSHQFPLAAWWARTRSVRFMDGPVRVSCCTVFDATGLTRACCLLLRPNANGLLVMVCAALSGRSSPRDHCEIGAACALPTAGWR